MALQLWETLKESIVAFTGLSPATFFTVLALGLAVYYVVSGLFGSLSDRHQRPRDYQEQMQPLPPPVQLVKTSEDELKQYDGTDPEKSLLMANRGQIYDVSQRRRSYDVFLSFRGMDVRNYFLGHLYTALVQSGINTYMDSEDLEKGEQISPTLMEAIEESQIAIVVFSKDYASSPWCLEEVAKIMECKEQRGLTVFPVFYKVEPREVRGGYGKAMAKHEVKFGKDSEKVKRWKKALLEAGSLSGLHFIDGCEAGLVQHIVQEILTQLDRTPLHIAKYQVGIDSRVQELKKILNLQSKDDILMVGLWGQGGVGKTTIAKAIYNSVFREFQGSCFLESVRENSKNSIDLVPLQKQMLSEVLLLRKKLKIFSVGRGNQLIQDRLCNKKVLVILDDVDDERQLNALAGNCEWFGKGSRIILTTRNKHLLTSHGVDSDHMYEVEALEDDEALELFRKHAFLRSQKIEISSNLIDEVLDYAGGLPLALEVLGSFLCGRGEHEWKSTLQKLSRSPDKKINDVLKVSYDGLEDYVKEIFLDIACFFKGQNTQYIRKVLDCCGFDTTIGVKILIEHSLISEEGGTLQMHDLIELMGKEIVKEECHDDAGKRSRLWLYDDVLEVLSGDMGTDAIKAIVSKLPMPKETCICPNAFTNMRKLRMLIIDNSFQGPIHLPNQLRWLEWPNCAFFPEFGYGPKKLVGLDMQNSKIKEMPKQFKDFIKLKFIDFRGCQSVVCMPNLDCSPNLEILNLCSCKNLERAHESVFDHKKLQFLNFCGCSKLHHLPGVLQSENLRFLDLNACSTLQRLPDFSDKMKGLQGLNLRRTSIEELPASIENLVSLQEMDLDNCKKLTILPSSIYRLPNLEFMTLRGCSKLVKFPKMEGDSSGPHAKIGFPKLRLLNLNECKLSEIEFLENPSCFPSLNYLFLMNNNFTYLPTCEQPVSYRQRIQEILDIPWQFQCQWAIGCESLSEKPSNICDCYNVHLSLCHGRFCQALQHTNMSNYKDYFHFHHGCQNVVLPGGEIPEWLLRNNDGHISFMATKDLLEKFLGIAFCVVIRAKCGIKDAQLSIIPDIDGLVVHYNVGGNVGGLFLPNFDHMLLVCFEPRLLWDRFHFGPNDWKRFMLTIRASDNHIVKKCGFRLICKPLENDLEIFLQHNQSLDPALLYEVRHEDNQMSMVERSSSETKDLLDNKTSREKNNSSDLILEGSKVTDIPIQNYRYSASGAGCQYNRNIVPGGEMPEEFVPVEDGTISFMASQDLYDKFLGLALCVVFSVEDGKKEISFDIVPHTNDERRNVLSGTLGTFDSDHTWIQYLKPNVLWGLLEGGVDFGQFDEIYLRFSLNLRVSGGTLKKLGYMIRCRRLEDDLKAVLEDNKSVNPASLYEEDYGDTEMDRHFRQREFFYKCHIYRRNWSSFVG